MAPLPSPAIAADAGSTTLLAPAAVGQAPPDLHGHQRGRSQRDQHHRQPTRVDAQPFAQSRQRRTEAADESAVHREKAGHRHQGLCASQVPGDRSVGVLRDGGFGHRSMLSAAKQ